MHINQQYVSCTNCKVGGEGVYIGLNGTVVELCRDCAEEVKRRIEYAVTEIDRR